MVPNLQQSSRLPSCVFQSHHQTSWPLLFFCCLTLSFLTFLTFSFQPSCPTDWSQIPSLLLHLFACIKSLYRHFNSLLYQAWPSPRQAIWNVCIQHIIVSEKCLTLLHSCQTQPCAVSFFPLSFPPPMTEPEVLPDTSTCSFPVVPPWICSADCLPLLSSQKGHTNGAGYDERTEGGNRKRYLHSSLFCRVSHKAGYHFHFQQAASSSHTHNC